MDVKHLALYLAQTVTSNTSTFRPHGQTALQPKSIVGGALQFHSALTEHLLYAKPPLDNKH